MANFWPLFCKKIRTSTSNLHKFINIQYLKNLIRISLDLLIIKKSIFLQRVIAAVIVYSCRFEKKLQFFLFTSRYLQQKSLVTFHRNLVFLLRKISEEVPNFEHVTVVIPLKEIMDAHSTVLINCFDTFFYFLFLEVENIPKTSIKRLSYREFTAVSPMTRYTALDKK